jgi:hypothetical protein
VAEVEVVLLVGLVALVVVLLVLPEQAVMEQ